MDKAPFHVSKKANTAALCLIVPNNFSLNSLSISKATTTSRLEQNVLAFIVKVELFESVVVCAEASPHL